jgi:hypothetical protein
MPDKFLSWTLPFDGRVLKPVACLAPARKEADEARIESACCVCASGVS